MPYAPNSLGPEAAKQSDSPDIADKSHPQSPISSRLIMKKRLQMAFHLDINNPAIRAAATALAQAGAKQQKA